MTDFYFGKRYITIPTFNDCYAYGHDELSTTKKLISWTFCCPSWQRGTYGRGYQIRRDGLPIRMRVLARRTWGDDAGTGWMLTRRIVSVSDDSKIGRWRALKNFERTSVAKEVLTVAMKIHLDFGFNHVLHYIQRTVERTRDGNFLRKIIQGN